MLQTDGKFYLGRVVDQQTRETTPTPLMYDPDDLTTHAVVVGMTGSGKTGLCLDLLEEAALNDIPALMIDPKGDITNALLHFPDLAADDFAPWINANEAAREGKSVAQAAAETADLWRNGLAGWDITPERIQRLKDGPRFAIYTPGSDAGLPVSILASLEAPKGLPWSGNEEMLREQISGTVTALLGLIGLKDIDPVRSREHILLANIFEFAWSRGKDLNLAELIMQTQSPPFAKLGVFEVQTFFPDKDRFELAMMLNNILAAPAFQSWISGEPLDIASLLYTPNGRPRHTIFYIAHLPEAERMFFVTLLYSAVEAWMRAQSGSTSLRALVYFDEIFGYLPPVGNPPSKKPMLRMLKQARAFGVGMVLATQNPVDVDYKALSNAGTWFIGKLATEQDKARLLDGLSSAMAGGVDTKVYDDLISALGKRVFLLRNVHEKVPQLFQTRWAMNYLAGPVMRTRIPELNALAGSGPEMTDAIAAPGGDTATPALEAAPPSPAPVVAEAPLELPGYETAPEVPRGIDEYFLPVELSVTDARRAYGRRLDGDGESQGVLYRPVLLALADIRFTNRKFDLNAESGYAALIHEPDDRGRIEWQAYERELESKKLGKRAESKGRFVMLTEPFSSSQLMNSMRGDLADWIYRQKTMSIKAHEKLRVFAGPDVDEAEFRKKCVAAAQPLFEIEAKKEADRWDKKIVATQKKLVREKRELKEDEEELKLRKREEGAKHVETIFGLFTGKRRSVSSSLTKRRMTEKAKSDVEESIDEIEAIQQEIAMLEEQREDAIEEIKQKWRDVLSESSDVAVQPYKKDIDVHIFGVAWFPYYLLLDGERLRELPAFAE